MIVSWRHPTLWMLLLLAGCAGRPLTQAQRARIIASVDSATRAFQAAQLAQDAVGTIAHLSPDFYMYLDGVRTGYDSVAASIHATMGSFQHLESVWSNLEVTPLGPDAALVTFSFRDSIVAHDGLRVQFRGPTTLVWEREGRDWRITFADADHYPVSGP